MTKFDDCFVQKLDAMGKVGFTLLQDYILVMHMLTYGEVGDREA